MADNQVTQYLLGQDIEVVTGLIPCEIRGQEDGTAIRTFHGGNEKVTIAGKNQSFDQVVGRILQRVFEEGG